MGLRPVPKAANAPVKRLQAETGIRLRMPRELPYSQGDGAPCCAARRRWFRLSHHSPTRSRREKRFTPNARSIALNTSITTMGRSVTVIPG